MQRYEVVLEVEVGEVVTVKQLIWHLLQAAAGQVNRVHPLRRNLTKKKQGRDKTLTSGSTTASETFGIM